MADSLQLMTESSATASSSKLHKLSNEEMNFNDDIDRISDLPDSVICHILSFLKTKNAAVTSILSTRWRYLWTWVTTLDFEYLRGFELVYLNVGDRVGYRSFVDLVCRALFLRNNGSCIKKFRLFCPVNSLDLESSDSFHFNAWVCAAVTRGVEELDLSHLIMMPFDQPVELTQCVELPQSLFTCKTLKVLNLYGEIVLNVPSSVHLPSLKILFLGCVKYGIDDSVSKLLTGCPVLENLSIGGFYCDKLRIISAPVLKKLKLRIVCSHSLDELNLSRPEINVPALEYLSIVVHSVSGAFPIENLSSLVEAELRFYVVEPNEYSSKCALELLRGLYNVKFLTLFSLKMETFRYVSNDDLPMFHNLTRLKIIGAWHLLPNFLENSHNLRVLSLKETCYRSDRHGCCRWPRCVPKCLSLHLMKIHIERFEGLKGELKLVRYILKNAKVLKTMSICCHQNSKEKARLLEKILMFPRGSETCQVTIN